MRLGVGGEKTLSNRLLRGSSGRSSKSLESGTSLKSACFNIFLERVVSVSIGDRSMISLPVSDSSSVPPIRISAGGPGIGTLCDCKWEFVGMFPALKIIGE